LTLLFLFQRSASSGSFGSFDSNSISVKSANSGSLIDSVLEPERAPGVQQADASTIPSLPQIPSAANTAKIDLFSQEFVQSQNTFMASSIDFFADVNNQPSMLSSNKQKPLAVPSSENEGWATFDLPRHAEPPSKASTGFPPVVPSGEKDVPKGNIDLFSSMYNNSDWFSVQNLASQGHSSLVADQCSTGLNEVQLSADSRNSQVRKEMQYPFHQDKFYGA